MDKRTPAPILPTIFTRYLFSTKADAVFSMLYEAEFEKQSFTDALTIMMTALMFNGFPPDTVHVYAIVNAMTQPGAGPKWGMFTNRKPLGPNTEFPDQPGHYSNVNEPHYEHVNNQVRNFWRLNGIDVLHGKLPGAFLPTSAFRNNSSPSEHWDERVEALEKGYHTLNLKVKNILERLGSPRDALVATDGAFDLTKHTASPEDIDAIGHGPDRRKGNFGVSVDEPLVVSEFSDTIPEDIYIDLRKEFVKQFPQGEDFSDDQRILDTTGFNKRVSWAMDELINRTIDPSVQNILSVMGLADGPLSRLWDIVQNQLQQARRLGCCVPADVAHHLQVGDTVPVTDLQGGVPRGQMWMVSVGTHNFKADPEAVTAQIRHTGPGFISN